MKKTDRIIKQTRIIAGSRKGRRLNNPQTGTRPLTDRIKTSLFDLIKDFIPNAKVLDLYAGGGNFGIEALSRGAKTAVFVDISAESSRIIQRNLDNSDLAEQAEIIHSSVQDFLRPSDAAKSPDSDFDIIFADPPFKDYVLEHVEEAAKLLKPGGIFILRLPSKDTPLQKIQNLKQTYSKKYGKSRLCFYQNL